MSEVRCWIKEHEGAFDKFVLASDYDALQARVYAFRIALLGIRRWYDNQDVCPVCSSEDDVGECPFAAVQNVLDDNPPEVNQSEGAS